MYHLKMSEKENLIPNPNDVSRNRILTDLAVLCVVWIFTFTAYSGLQNLETSLNPEIGAYSLAALTGGGLLSCLIAPAIIGFIGIKGSLIVSWICLCIFVCSNYYPTVYILIPGSLIEGMATGLMWTVQGTYITLAASRYSALSGESKHTVLSRFFGIFCTAFQSTQIWGNLVSSLVLQNSNHTSTTDGEEKSIANMSTGQCGSNQCPLRLVTTTNSTRSMDDSHPDQATLDILVSTYLVCAIMGLFMTVVCLKPDKLEQTEHTRISGSGKYSNVTSRNSSAYADNKGCPMVYENKHNDASAEVMDCTSPTGYRQLKSNSNISRLDLLWMTVMSTLRMLVTNLNVVLLIPLSMYTGLDQAVMYSEFTKDFVTCELGVAWIGYTMICFGVTTTIGSPISGILGKYLGSLKLFYIAAILNMGIVVLMLLWIPDKENMTVFFIIPAVWGLGDAIWQTQNGVYFGIAFPDQKEPAFANLHLFQALGFTVSYLYSNALCQDTKLYIVASMLIITIVTVTIVEQRLKKTTLLRMETLETADHD